MKSKVFIGGLGIMAIIAALAGGRHTVIVGEAASANTPKTDMAEDSIVRELSRQIAAAPRSRKLRRQLADRYVALGQSRRARRFARDRAMPR